MSITKKTYSVGKIKQLVDLNGESTNFDAQFRIVSKNKEPFYLLVVDQTTLDNNPNLEYKKADKGEISGHIVHDKNVYQNYFIILKADEPCECDVEITKKELPKTPDMPVTKSPQQTKKSDSFNMTNILIIVGTVVITGALFYYFYYKTNAKQTPANSRLPSPVNSPRNYQRDYDLALPSPRESIVSRKSVADVPIGGGGGPNKLLERLKSLKM